MPLPALSSNILRIICDDDLQVAHEDNEDDDNEMPASLTVIANSDGHDNNRQDSGSRKTYLVKAPLSSNSSSSELAGAAIPKHSPLTRRLSKTPIKPRIEINLASSPQCQKKLQQVQQHEPVNNNELDSSHDCGSTTFKATTRELRTE